MGDPETEQPALAAEIARLTKENEELQRKIATVRPGAQAAAIERLTAENAELQRQVAKAPPAGPAKGTAVCFRRVNETVCRPAVMVSDGYVDSVSKPGGMILHALIEYGDPAGSPERMAMVGTVEKAVPHGFQVNRGYSPGGEPDTWHLPKDCPWDHDPKICPFIKDTP